MSYARLHAYSDTGKCHSGYSDSYGICPNFPICVNKIPLFKATIWLENPTRMTCHGLFRQLEGQNLVLNCTADSGGC